MPKSWKGQAAARSDFWAIAGGVNAVLESFMSIEILKQDTSSKSPVRSRLALKLFQCDMLKNKKWLYVVWTFNRKNIKRLVEVQSSKEKESSPGKAKTLTVKVRMKIQRCPVCVRKKY